MKRHYTNIVLGLLAAGVLLVAGCKREYGTVTLGANIDNGRDAKVYIDNLTPCWHNNDLIRVNNQNCTTSAALGSTAQITDVVESNHYRAIYPADIVGNVDISSGNTIAVTLPREQQYEVDSYGDQKVKVPMGAYSDNESLTFHNLCSLIKVVISSKFSFTLEKITVTAGNSYLSGQGTAVVSGYSSDFIEMIPSSANHEVSLVFPSTNVPILYSGDRNTYVYYIVVPEFATDNVSITLYSHGGNISFVKQGVSLSHNKIAQVNLTLEQWTEAPNIGGLLGVFSVSNTRRVYFSKGNLQYQASTNTWRFADRQYDFVGGFVGSGNDVEYVGTMDGNSNTWISSTNTRWIDLFGWGTSGWSGSGATYYQPWSSQSGSYPFDDQYPESDWAWHNAISNGGNAVHVWRSLDCWEWYYLFNSRHDASQKYGTGRVDGVGGLIILPDNWILPEGCTFVPGFASTNNDWSHNSYYSSRMGGVSWDKMEAAGAVFLPAAGYRVGTTTYKLGEGGFYWPFTADGDNSDGVSSISFYSNEWTDGSPYIIIRNYYGLSVRPVLDIN